MMDFLNVTSPILDAEKLYVSSITTLLTPENASTQWFPLSRIMLHVNGSDISLSIISVVEAAVILGVFAVVFGGGVVGRVDNWSPLPEDTRSRLSCISRNRGRCSLIRPHLKA